MLRTGARPSANLGAKQLLTSTCVRCSPFCLPRQSTIRIGVVASSPLSGSGLLEQDGPLGIVAMEEEEQICLMH